MTDSQGASLPSCVAPAKATCRRADGARKSRQDRHLLHRASNLCRAPSAIRQRPAEFRPFGKPRNGQGQVPSGKIASSPSPSLGENHVRPPTKAAPDLFTPIIWALALPNIAMAPLTRSPKVTADRAQRALLRAARSAGLIIAEATQVTPQGQYISTPGIHSAEQIKGWQCVTGAVPASGGGIVLQLHVGRISHQSFQPGGKLPLRPQPSGRTDRLSPPKVSSRSPAHAPSSSPRFPASSRNTRKERGTRWKQASTASRYMARTAI